ncbi:MAG: hypothetical protein L3J24_03290 [Xanthomonadales bacterium]|nr:hypothetical protein [Xanthomonadales bacterium]
MSNKTYNLQGYTLVIDKIQFVTALFAADDNEGVQFNIGFGGDTRIVAKFPNRADATLARELLVKALNQK